MGKKYVVIPVAELEAHMPKLFRDLLGRMLDDLNAVRVKGGIPPLENPQCIPDHPELIDQIQSMQENLDLYKPFYDAVTNEGVVTCIGWDDKDAKKSLHNIINWHVAVALDPKVSSDAQALIKRGWDECDQRVND